MRTLLPASLLLTILAALTLPCTGCTRPMGMACADSGVCGQGTCLKGVCSGYECSDAIECSGDYVCGQVQGLSMCVLECDGDEDCGGDQTCEEVAETLEDDGPTIFACM